MTNAFLRKTLYKLAWDTRCRNVDVARVLDSRVGKNTALLDAGCGEHGLAAFLDSGRIVGVDVLPTDVRTEGFSFVHGSILDLPFADREFAVAASVDVLEHLPAGLRRRAVAELVRCAARTIVLTFPSGKLAREVDENYARDLRAAGEELPDWLAEHLESDYPDAAEIARMITAEAEASARTVEVTFHYSEPISVAKKLRALSLRSKYFYLLANLAAGALLPVIPAATAENAYRAIVLADFTDG